MSHIVGIVLAAGESTRFGDQNKLLAEYREQPLITHATESLDVDSIDSVVAVLGHDFDAISSVVQDQVDEICYNPQYEAGLSSSVRVGVTSTPAQRASAALFLPGDMPCVSPEAVSQIVGTYVRGHGEIIIPTYESTRGNPVLFDAAQFDALSTLSGDSGGRQLFASAETRRLEVDDPGIRIDIDTEEQLRKLRNEGCGDWLI